MKNRIRRFFAIMICVIIVGTTLPAIAEQKAEQLTLLFSSDIHSYYESYTAEIEGRVREHGGAGRLKTLVSQYSNDHSIYLDAGDFAMGTLMHAGYATDAYELRLLGNAGCDATTFGNHEFDFGGAGAAQMLRSAMQSGDPLPDLIIPANLEFTAEQNRDQKELAAALEEIGSERYRIYTVSGIRVGVFALMGKEAGMYTPTAGVNWRPVIDAAKEIVGELKNKCDVIICISHSGTNGDGKTGEDLDLAKKVPEIDVIVSGHSHTVYHNVVTQNGVYLGSPGEYLSYLGKMELSIAPDGKVTCNDYELIPCDENVEADPETEARVASYREEINRNYLAPLGMDYDMVIAHSDFDFMSLSAMYENRDEYPMAELIADSYRYACDQAGIDIDVAMVGLGTIRGSITRGDITVANAFEICSLGVGSDGTAGHPLLSFFAKGSDLKLLTELDAVAGGFMANFRMSFSGLSYVYDVNRAPLDRVRDLCVEREDGTKEPVEKDRLYRIAINMYAANLLDGLKSMSYGIVDLLPVEENGQPIDMRDLYAYAIKNTNGRDIREWEALCLYLASFEKVNGVSVIPEYYAEPLGRKVEIAGKGFDRIRNPGTSTAVLMVVCGALLIGIIYLIASRKRRAEKRAKLRAARGRK